MANIDQLSAGSVTEAPTTTGASHEFDAKARKQSTVILRRFLRHRLAMSSTALFLLLVLFAFLGPLLLKYNFQDTSAPAYLAPGQQGHWLGTTQVGTDMMAQILRGSQYSLLIAIVVAIASTAVGVVLGAMAGYLQGWADSLIMRVVDLFLLFPYIAAAAILVHAFKGSWIIVAVILAMFFWMQTARITRGEALSLSQREFVEAARAAGAGTARIIFRHLVPNMIGSITVNATLSVAQAVLAEAALSFIGLGVQLPDTSLGVIVSDNYANLIIRPWLFWGPFLMLVLICLAINFIGDGLRDAFDPRQTKVRA